MVLGPGTLGPGGKTLRRRGRGQSTQRRSWTQEQGPGSTPARGQRRRRSSALGPARGLVLGGDTHGSHQHQLKFHVLPAPSALPGPGPLPRPFGHLTLYIHEQRAPLPPWTAGSTAGGTWPRLPSLGARPVSGTQHTLGKCLLTRRAGSARTHVGGPPGQAHGGAVQPPACPLSAPAHLSFR